MFETAVVAHQKRGDVAASLPVNCGRSQEVSTARRRPQDQGEHNLASLKQPLEGEREIFGTTLDEAETQKVGLSANLARDFTRGWMPKIHRHAGGSLLKAIGRSPGLSWSDRGHHVPALTVTSGGRGVGFDVACSRTPCGCRRLPFFFSAPHLIVHLSLLLRQQRAVDVAASLKPTVAASAERSSASFEMDDDHSGTRFLASGAPRRRDTWWFHFVTGQMVGDRRFPRAEILGWRVFLLLPSTIPCLSPPTGYVHRDAFWCGQCTRWQVLCVQAGSFSCLQYTTLRRPCCQLLRQLVRCFCGARSRGSLTS